MDNLTLRSFTLKDAQELFTLTGSNRLYLREWLSWLDNTNSVEDSLSFIQSAMANPQQGLEQYFFVCEYDNIIGTCALRRLDTNTPEIGYWLSESHRGTDITAWAVLQLVEG
ncbi:GNAT family N-acetyltransferase [Riemerella columbipharyngis]|uniref:Ribosomal-protein-serine acetyltransferase n=1 Tax=Riemerella columbipharyngis TaxID=1071918 RepID=A0A1G7BZA0_9FLAO|nr:GNAT family N-acetyltransferase [Riemerella columbipharyngis]SDE32418.1 ribosomal-protein-serine acetyltransferase [Riemerella columbipharyngis]